MSINWVRMVKKLPFDCRLESVVGFRFEENGLGSGFAALR